jgi:hypothetical protein
LAAAEKFDGAENPPKKNAAGQISAEDKKCGRRRICFRPVFGGGTKSARVLFNMHYRKTSNTIYIFHFLKGKTVLSQDLFIKTKTLPFKTNY